MPCDVHRLGPPGTHTPWRAGILSIGSLSARVLIFLCACTQGRINYEEFVKVMMSTKQAI